MIDFIPNKIIRNLKLKSKINYIILILLLSLNIFFLTIRFNSNIPKISDEIFLPKQSGGYTLSFIHVDGNWTDTTAYDWCYGQGTWKEPYVIENVTINCGGTGSGIFIQNSNDYYFIIKNCTIFNAGSTSIDAGIKFVNASNGMIYNNTCSYNQNHGILLYTDCNNNTILENIANYNFDGGIYLESTCEENFIINNTINNNAVGIMLTNTVAGICHHNEILNNSAKENGVGIWLSQSNYNTVSGNRLINNSKTTFGTAGNGIRISFYSYGGKSKHNLIKNNVIRYGIYGIFMYDGENNTISDNIITRNSMDGIYFHTFQTSFNCEYNIIANNSVNENGNNGIFFYESCRYNTITNNTLNDNKEYGIYLLSTSDGNNITHNTLKRNLCGILLRSSYNNNVSENILIDNGVCIYEQYCYGNIFENNYCSGSKFQTPILINAAATGYGANNWTWAESQPWCSGSGTEEDPYLIENLIINGLGVAEGIEIQNSEVYFIIQQCTILNADYGIYLDTVNNSLIIDNNCSNNQEGIYVEYGNDNAIIGNLLNDNENSGLHLFESNNTLVYQNTAIGNYDGIYLDTDCDNNIIECNIVNNNSDGIYIYDCDYNNISSNTVNYNQNYGVYLEICQANAISHNNVNNNRDYGILFEINSNNNEVIKNSINYNEYGIVFSESSCNNSISKNKIAYNNVGIELEDSSDENEFIRNILFTNALGVNIISGNNNTFYLNIFLKNEKHAVDNAIENKWNTTLIGNYWDNHTGPDVAPQDGIVDLPYVYIGGTAGSIDYLPKAEDGAPRITIISPTEGSKFKAIAPSFVVEIVDDFLYEMWYTLDDGLHNYTFTDFAGSINQSVWDVLPEGEITIKFYARDIPGNVAFKVVTIIKDLSVGLDPGVLVLIVILSIIGSVAVAGVILWYFFKNGKISLEKLKKNFIRKK